MCQVILGGCEHEVAARRCYGFRLENLSCFWPPRAGARSFFHDISSRPSKLHASAAQRRAVGRATGGESTAARTGAEARGRTRFWCVLGMGCAASKASTQITMEPVKLSDECRLRIFHVNDVYVLDNFPALKACIGSMSQGQPNVLTTLAGDFLAPSLLSSIDQGRGMVNVMNALPIDAVCFGNHEADVPYLSLISRVNEFAGAWVNSNMPSFSAEESALQPGKCPDHHLLRLTGGRTVALLGLNVGGGANTSLYRDDAFGGHAKRITPVLEAAAGAVERARAACGDGVLDCALPMTHQLIDDDRQLCQLGLPFPVVLGGHEHDVYDETVCGTRILKAGADACNVMVVDIVWEAGTPPGAMPTSVSAQLVPLCAPKGHKGPPPELPFAPGDAALRKTCAYWEQPAVELQQAVMAIYEPGFLSSMDVRSKPSTMATAIATAFRATERADGAIINAGGVRGQKTYEDGKVTFADLNRECPFPSENIVISVSGQALSDAVQRSRAEWPQSSGMALHGDDAMEMDPHTHRVVAVGGAPLEPERLYTIVCDSYIVKSNEPLRAYASAHPERFPADDAGRPALPILVQHYCDRVWRKLLDRDENGDISREEAEALFDEADTSPRDGVIDHEELHAVIGRRLGGLQASKIIAKQCISILDVNQDGVISKEELLTMLAQEVAARHRE